MHKLGFVHYPDTQHRIALACSAAVCQHIEQHGQKEVKNRSKKGSKEAKKSPKMVKIAYFGVNLGNLPRFWTYLDHPRGSTMEFFGPH